MMSVAWGWMFAYKKLGDLDLYVPIFMFIGIAHMLVGALTYVNHDDYDKFYDYQGVQGLIIVILRICLYIAFVIGYMDTLKKIGVGGNTRQY